MFVILITITYLFQISRVEINSSYAGRAYKVNVWDAEEVESAILEQTKEFNGRLDVFVANAGIPWTQGPVIEGSLKHYRDVMATNLDGVYYCARACGRIWKRQRVEGTDMFGKKLEKYSYGSFIATASMSGHIVNIPLVQTAYNASKAGVSHMCKSHLILSTTYDGDYPDFTKPILTQLKVNPWPLNGASTQGQTQYHLATSTPKFHSLLRQRRKAHGSIRFQWGKF
jgi:hypothetical protein